VLLGALSSNRHLRQSHPWHACAVLHARTAPPAPTLIAGIVGAKGDEYRTQCGHHFGMRCGGTTALAQDSDSRILWTTSGALATGRLPLSTCVSAKTPSELTAEQLLWYHENIFLTMKRL